LTGQPRIKSGTNLSRKCAGGTFRDLPFGEFRKQPPAPELIQTGGNAKSENLKDQPWPTRPSLAHPIHPKIYSAGA
jgi:hypothetical protein